MRPRTRAHSERVGVAAYNGTAMDLTARANTLTFGVEIETIGPNDFEEVLALAVGGDVCRPLRPQPPVVRSEFGVWSVVPDASIETTTSHPLGREFVSPVFRYPDDTNKVAGMTRALESAGFTVNASCGLHVHVGVGDRAKDPRLILAALAASYEWSRVVHLLLCDRRLDASFCEVHSAWALSQFAGFYSGHQPPTYQRVMRRLLDADPRKVGPTTDKLELPRNFGFNLTALARHGTIEYRFFEGTLRPDLVLAYVELCARFTALALEARPLLRAPRKPTEANMEALLDLLGVSAESRAVLLTDEVRAHARGLMLTSPIKVPRLDLSLLDAESQRLARQALRACG